jgi:hypothetical protein
LGVVWVVHGEPKVDCVTDWVVKTVSKREVYMRQGQQTWFLLWNWKEMTSPTLAVTLGGLNAS